MWETPDADCVCKATGRGGVGRPPANLKTSQFWSSHQRSHASTESHVDHPSGLILQPLLKFAIPTKICYHSSTSNSKQANHFKPNFCLNHLCRSDGHTDAAQDSHLPTACHLGS